MTTNQYDAIIIGGGQRYKKPPFSQGLGQIDL